MTKLHEIDATIEKACAKGQHGVVIGMCTRFVGCEIKCDLSLCDVVGSRIRFEECDTTVERSELSQCTIGSGIMYYQMYSRQLEETRTITRSYIGIIRVWGGIRD